MNQGTSSNQYVPSRVVLAIVSSFCFLLAGIVAVAKAVSVARLGCSGNIEATRAAARGVLRLGHRYRVASLLLFVPCVLAAACSGASETNTNTVSAPTARPTATPMPHAYRIMEIMDSTWGPRERRTLNIQAPTAKTQEDRMAVVRRAAIEYIERYSRVDAVAVRLFTSEQVNAVARVVYAPDKCGWAGDDCSNSVWRK